jgi:hypothetical protein
MMPATATDWRVERLATRPIDSTTSMKDHWRGRSMNRPRQPALPTQIVAAEIITVRTTSNPIVRPSHGRLKPFFDKGDLTGANGHPRPEFDKRSRTD